MFVLTETYNAMQKSDSPTVAIVLGIAFVVIMGFAIWKIFDCWRGR